MLTGEGTAALRQLSSEDLCMKLRETGKAVLSKVADIFEEQELDGEDLTSIIYEELCVLLPKLGMRKKLETFLSQMGITMQQKILPDERPSKKRKLEVTADSISGEPDKKLWVRGVPIEKNNVAEMSMFFSKFGNIENLQVIREQNEALLQFSTAEEATNCFEQCQNERVMGEPSIQLERYGTSEEDHESELYPVVESVEEETAGGDEPMEVEEETKDSEREKSASSPRGVEKATPNKITTGCPGQHELRTYIASDKSSYYTCSACSKSIAQVFGCRICEWDICPSCLPADKRVRRSNQASTVWCPACLTHSVNHKKEPSTRISIVDFSTSIKASSDDKHRCDICEHIEFDNHSEFLEHISSVAHRLRVSLKLAQDPLLHEYMCKLCPKKKNAFRQMTTPSTWQTHLLGSVHRVAADKYAQKILTPAQFVQAYKAWRDSLPEEAYQPTPVVFNDNVWKPEDDDSSDDDIFDFSEQGEDDSDNATFELMSEEDSDGPPKENVQADGKAAQKGNKNIASKEKLVENYGVGVCWSFQRGKCRRKNCVFPHSCAYCRSKLHGGYSCPERKNNKTTGKQKAVVKHQTSVVKPSAFSKAEDKDGSIRKKRKLNAGGSIDEQEKSTRGLCSKYNKGNCYNRACVWRHMCRICKKSGHGAYKCPEKKKSKASNMRVELKNALVEKLSKEHQVSVQTMNQILEAAELMRRTVSLEGLPRCQSKSGLQALVTDLKDHIRQFSAVQPDQLQITVKLLSSSGRVMLKSTSHDKVFKVTEVLNGLLLKPDFVVSAKKDTELSNFLPNSSEQTLFSKLSPILVKIYPTLFTASHNRRKKDPLLSAKGVGSAPLPAAKEKPVFTRARNHPPPPVSRNPVYKGTHGGAGRGYPAAQPAVSARPGAHRGRGGGYPAVQAALPARQGINRRGRGGYPVVQPIVPARQVAQRGRGGFRGVQPTVPARRGRSGKHCYAFQKGRCHKSSCKFDHIIVNGPNMVRGVQQAVPYGALPPAPVTAAYPYPVAQGVPQHVVPVYGQSFTPTVYQTQAPVPAPAQWQPYGAPR